MFGFLFSARARSRRAATGVGAALLAVPAGRVDVGEGRPVRVRPFALDVRPVTNAEWAEFARITGARRPEWLTRRGFNDPDQPVVGITYPEAEAFARWVGKRLPTEFEWLRAARGDDHRRYPWGDGLPNSSLAHFSSGPSGAPAEVGAGHRAAGRGVWGHRDLCGNVWEWCRGAVLRGGFWGSTDVQIDLRMVERPTRQSAGIGLRCAR